MNGPTLGGVVGFVALSGCFRQVRVPQDNREGSHNTEGPQHDALCSSSRRFTAFQFLRASRALDQRKEPGKAGLPRSRVCESREESREGGRLRIAGKGGRGEAHRQATCPWTRSLRSPCRGPTARPARPPTASGAQNDQMNDTDSRASPRPAHDRAGPGKLSDGSGVLTAVSGIISAAAVYTSVPNFKYLSARCTTFT